MIHTGETGFLIDDLLLLINVLKTPPWPVVSFMSINSSPICAVLGVTLRDGVLQVSRVGLARVKSYQMR